MHELSNADNAILMSSLELVDFINGVRGHEEAVLAHADFLKKVPHVLGGGHGNFSDTYTHKQNGQTYPFYRFPKREACLMAMSYSYDLQAKVFDRMTALEAQQAAMLSFNLPKTYSAAMRLAADQADQIEALTIGLDHAIATKAQIGNKREATAMATASAAKRESAKLKDQLGFSARHATILQVEDAVGGDFGFVDLRRWCKANEVTPETVPDKRYPKGVKAWPAAAWMSVFGVDLASLFGEVSA